MLLFLLPSKAYNTIFLQNYPDTLKIFLFKHRSNTCHISISRQNKNHNPLIELWLKKFKMSQVRFELTTYGLEDRCSIQLSHCDKQVLL